MLFNFKRKSNFRNNTHMTNFQAQPHRPPLVPLYPKFFHTLDFGSSVSNGNITKFFFFIIIHIFSIHFAINLFYLYILKT